MTTGHAGGWGWTRANCGNPNRRKGGDHLPGRQPEDARLLLQASKAQLLADAELPPETRQALADLNKPVADLLHQLATDVFGTAAAQQVDLVTIAVVDVPYAIVRRHLQQGTSAETHRHLIARTVRALVESSR